MIAVGGATTLVSEARSKWCPSSWGWVRGVRTLLAEGLAVHGLAAVAHQDDGPGTCPLGDLLLGHWSILAKRRVSSSGGAGGSGGDGGSTMTGGRGGGAVAHPANCPG